MLKQPTLYISSSEATQHIHRFQITKETHSHAHIYEGRKHTAQITHTTTQIFNAEAAYAVHFF